MPGTTAFPTALDTFPNITATTQEDASGFEHDVVHNNEAAAIAALEAKVGIDGSAVTTSLDYRVASLEASGSLHFRRDDLTAVAGDNRIVLNKTPYEGSLNVFKNGTLLYGAAGILTGKNYDISTAATGGEVFTASYWTSDASPAASSITNAGFNFTAQVVADGAVDFWLLDDSGSTAANQVSGGNTLAIGSSIVKGVTPPLVPLYSGCVRLSGGSSVSDAITGTPTTNLAQDADFSMMAVISAPSVGGNSEVFHLGDYAVGGQQGVEWYINSGSGAMNLYSSSGGNTAPTFGLGVLPANTPCMIHLVYSNTAQTVKFYLNGSLIQSVSRTSGHTAGMAASLGISKSGSGYSSGLPANSKMQAVAWFASALTDAKVLVHAQKAGFA